MRRARLLIVENDRDVLLELRDAAGVEMLDIAVEIEGSAALATAQSFKPDLVIVDVDLRGSLSGFDVARRLRDQGDAALVFLSGQSSLEDRLAGFRAGGDDYVTKPFFPEEMGARIQAILRRRGSATSSLWHVGDVTVDEGSRQVSRSNCSIDLTRTEFDILVVLVRYRGRVVPKAALAAEIWGYEQSRNVLEVHMSALRRKLEAHGDRCIHTVRGVGYVLRPTGA